MKRTNFLSMLLFFAAAPALMLPVLPKATPTKTVQPSSCLNNPAVPYAAQLKAAVATLPKQQQQEIETLWCSLYSAYQAQSKSPVTTPQAVASSPEIASAYKAIVQEQLFDRMLAYLNPKTFPKLLNDPQGTVHTNYATQHLRQALTRLASISKIIETKDAPQIEFIGDNRDLGIIVNIQNNTNAEFSISQTSLDGKTSVQIGQLNHGLNEVNLHTAALQRPANSKAAATSQPSNFSFEITQSEAESPITISIKMMSGQEFLTFLKTLPRGKKAIEKDTFEMNGLPTSPEYLASPKDWYLVLIQNPTPATAAERDPNQRIQAINISKLTGPYLLTMQINQQDIEIKSSNVDETDSTKTIFQPSITNVQIMKNATTPTLTLPLLILPQFLWKLPTAQTLWMIMSTTQLALYSNFKFFGKDSFGDAFTYFKNLSCFDNQNRYAFFISLTNTFLPDYVIYNAPWLMASAIYETNLSNCSDIPLIYTGQDAYGHIVVNQHNFYYINFLAIFTPQIAQTETQTFFNEKGFNIAYAYPLSQLYSFIVNALATDIKEGIFGALTEITTGVYQLTWTNKKNKVITSQVLYLNAPISNVEISFVNQTTNWVGSSVPTQLIQLTPGTTTHFKVTYEFSPANSKHILLAQATSPIDKQAVFLPLQFTKYPINELYVDTFNTFNVKPYTRCYIVKNGILPEPLAGLTRQDWQSGIYMVPVVKNNKNLSSSNPGAFTALFYKSDKTYLGEMTIPGQYNNHNTSSTGIKEPVHSYTIHFSEFNCLRDLYLSTGVLLQYSQTS
ncbi:MAG: hypothetical protein WC747_01960 [Candidatus Babeliales bacterium]